jgi:hypothetical protein
MDNKENSQESPENFEWRKIDMEEILNSIRVRHEKWKAERVAHYESLGIAPEEGFRNALREAFSDLKHEDDKWYEREPETLREAGND